MRWNIYFPVIFFWIAISIMIGTILYQSLKIEIFPYHAKIVLLEIAIASIVFHLIYQIPYSGLRGLDVYKDMACAKGISL